MLDIIIAEIDKIDNEVAMTKDQREHLNTLRCAVVAIFGKKK